MLPNELRARERTDVSVSVLVADVKPPRSMIAPRAGGSPSARRSLLVVARAAQQIAEQAVEAGKRQARDQTAVVSSSPS